MKLFLLLLILPVMSFADTYKDQFRKCTIYSNSVAYRGDKTKVAGFINYKCKSATGSLNCLIYKNKIDNKILESNFREIDSDAKYIAYSNKKNGARIIIDKSNKKIIFQAPYKADDKTKHLSTILCRGELKKIRE